MRSLYTYSLILPILWVISGCAGVPAEAPASPAVVRACRDSMELAGRFSVRYQQDSREEAAHGSFQWRQAGQRASVTLLSPLGQTIATIDITPAAATLTMAGQPPRMATDVDALVAQALGWPLPVSGLRDWLQGCARLADGSRFIARPGQEQAITQDGWHLRYPLWEQAGAVAPHPKRIDLQRQAGDGDVSLRLVIDVWQQGGK